MQFLSRVSSSLLSGAVTILYVISVTNFHYCVSQRNPPQGASNLYTYGRGDIPVFNPGDPHEALLAQLRKLIIAIR